MGAIVRSLGLSLELLSLGLEWKLPFSSPVATAEFSKFAGILSTFLKIVCVCVFFFQISSYFNFYSFELSLFLEV